jgi:threonine/homoserine/homoserine lactone efflux protein
VTLVDDRLLGFIAVGALFIVTPGPDTALTIRNALRYGGRGAARSTLGIALGSAVWAIASVLGVAIILETSLVAFTILKIAGAAYLMYLGVRSFTTTARESLTVRERAGGPFMQGLLSNLLNPKAAVFFVTVLPQFVVAGDEPSRFALMLATYEAMLLLWLDLYGVVVARAGRSRIGARVRAVLQRATGVVLIALGARLAFERR